MAFFGCIGLYGCLTISSNNITIEQYAFVNTRLNQINVTSENIITNCSRSSFADNISYVNVPKNYQKTEFCGIEIKKENDNNKHEGDNSLGVGEISAIIVAVVVVIIVAAFVAYLFIKRNEDNQSTSSQLMIL